MFTLVTSIDNSGGNINSNNNIPFQLVPPMNRNSPWMGWQWSLTPSPESRLKSSIRDHCTLTERIQLHPYPYIQHTLKCGWSWSYFCLVLLNTCCILLLWVHVPAAAINTIQPKLDQGASFQFPPWSTALLSGSKIMSLHVLATFTLCTKQFHTVQACTGLNALHFCGFENVVNSVQEC